MQIYFICSEFISNHSVWFLSLIKMIRKTVLGLKADPQNFFEDLNEDEEDDDDIFGDDSEPFPKITCTTSNLDQILTNAPCDPIQKLRESSDNLCDNKISSFDDAFSRISTILLSLTSTEFQKSDTSRQISNISSHNNINQLFHGKNIDNGNNLIKLTSLMQYRNSVSNLVYPNDDDEMIKFVPEHLATDELTDALNTYIRSNDDKLEFESLLNNKEDLKNAHKSILAQIDLVKYSKGQKVDIKSYENDQLDPQIMELIYYVLSKDDDRKISCYYLIQALDEYSKCNILPPISKLFPNSTMKDTFHSIALHLVNLFPRNPLLPSVLHKFSLYDPSALDALNLIPESDDDDFDDDDFSDSFFDTISRVQNNTPMIQLNGIFNEKQFNPLDHCKQTTSNAVTVTVYEPPSMVTFQMNDGNIQLTPNLFTDWISSLAPKTVQLSLKSSINSTMKSSLSASSPLITSKLKRHQRKQPATKEGLISLLADHSNPSKIKTSMPEINDPKLFPYHFPLVQIINSSSNSPYCQNFLFPSIIKYEFMAHQALYNNDIPRIETLLKDLCSKIPTNHPNLENIEIKPLQEKRDFSNFDGTLNDNIENAIVLSDIIIILNGRSPFTLDRALNRDFSTILPYPAKDIAKLIYYYYITFTFPPYINFRLAFALALKLSGDSTSETYLAGDFLFESIYGLSLSIPSLIPTPCVKTSLLFFADVLDRLDRYYYSALFLDSFFLCEPKYSSSSLIAQYCHQRRDMPRTLFHFSQILQSFVEQNKCEEALYVSQIITSIYHDYGMGYFSISMLAALLQKTYHISLKRNKIEKNSSRNFKTLTRSQQNVSKLPRIQIQTNPLESFEPNPTSTNALLNGISLVDLLIKARFYRLAASLLLSLQKTTENRIYRAIIDFFIMKLRIHKNNFETFVTKIPKLNMNTRRSSSGSRLSLRAATNFDSTIATILLLSRSYMNRFLFGQAIFWSEVIINSQTRLALNDLGRSYLARGFGYIYASLQMHVKSGPFSVKVPLTPIMKEISHYVDYNRYYTRADIISEAIASLKCASICFEKIGCTRKLIISTLLYVDVILHFFLDNGDLSEEDETHLDWEIDQQTKNDNENEIDLKIENKSNKYDSQILYIKPPVLETASNSVPDPTMISFEPFEISKDNIENELSVIITNNRNIITKIMYPTFILYSQIVTARFMYFMKKYDISKENFEFAFSNLKRFFASGGYILYQDLPLKIYVQIHTILEIACSILLRYDKKFINDHLVMFDLLNHASVLLNNSLRVAPAENKMPIQPSIIVSLNALKGVSSPQFPDFFTTLENSGARYQKESDIPDNALISISLLIRQIDANVKLFESQKMKEDEMHENNRELCRQLEEGSAMLRRDNSHFEIIDNDFEYLSRSCANVNQTVFVQQIHGSIVIYVPATGKQRRIILEPIKPKSQSNHSSSTSTHSSNSNSLSTIHTNIHTSTHSSSSHSSNNINTNSHNTTNCSNSESDDDDPANYYNTFTYSRKSGDVKFSSSSETFPINFMEYLCQLLIIDRGCNNKKISTKLSEKVLNGIRKTLFDGILPDSFIKNSEWKIENDSLFGSGSHFKSSLKGTLFSIAPPPKPIIFITDNYTSSIPFELLFKQCHVQRMWNFSLLTHSMAQKSTEFPTIYFLRRQSDIDLSTTRSISLINYCISSLGGQLTDVQYVNKDERAYNYVLPCFNSNKDNAYYNSKYPYCTFIEKPEIISTNDSVLNNGDNSHNEYNKNHGSASSDNNQNFLYIMSYSDLCENPVLLQKLSQQKCGTIFMFIPAQLMKEALHLIKTVFERQKKRQAYVAEMKNSGQDKDFANHERIAKNPYDFIVSLQATLIATFDCPIPLFYS
ncbi:hypothetical protein TRFO_31555 [Tritrichomonas foetus]|uniref:Uncharacterized protein n=1 Tax=Tritrichomonas foetus TaxID=1144522 RepID=A0A1J4JWA8_9EUKA|nr:hypothetical protein TRFO_31555 [Tritrichomonas foetus]|eukprot:OHT01573.1 hypothetical protein TRFO_31555 [Tritrichomonas foetus]